MKRLLILAMVFAAIGLTVICPAQRPNKVSMKLVSWDFCTDEVSSVTVLFTNRSRVPVLIDVGSIGMSGEHNSHGKWEAYTIYPKRPQEFVRLDPGMSTKVGAKVNLFSMVGKMRLVLDATVIPAEPTVPSSQAETTVSTRRTRIRFRSCS